MYSNARFANPLIARKKAPKSATDDFQVGTLAPSFDSFVPATLIPRLHKKEKRLFDTSQKSTVVFAKPEIFQLNPATVPFSSFRNSTHSTSNDSSAVPFAPKYHEPPIPQKAGTTVELPKNRPIAEHVGTSHHQ